MIATQNRGKMVEISRILAEIPLDIVNLSEFSRVDPPAEDGDTFWENAILKAEFYSSRFDITAIADDSGIEVDALGGAPGVRSARYGGAELTDAERADLLLSEMSGVPETARTARFVCVATIAGPNLTNGAISAQGVIEGKIADRPRGHHGFGYDPVFVPTGHTRSMAELSASEKNAISHRRRAIAALKPVLQALYS